jgi:hypothetical protein
VQNPNIAIALAPPFDDARSPVVRPCCERSELLAAARAEAAAVEVLATAREQAAEIVAEARGEAEPLDGLPSGSLAGVPA